jgi:hypothetical protein
VSVDGSGAEGPDAGYTDFVEWGVVDALGDRP